MCWSYRKLGMYVIHLISLNTSSSFYAIARHMNNPLIENKFVSPIRKKFDINVFPKKNAILKLRRVLKKR